MQRILIKLTMKPKASAARKMQLYLHGSTMVHVAAIRTESPVRSNVSQPALHLCQQSTTHKKVETAIGWATGSYLVPRTGDQQSIEEVKGTDLLRRAQHKQDIEDMKVDVMERGRIGSVGDKVVWALFPLF